MIVFVYRFIFIFLVCLAPLSSLKAKQSVSEIPFELYGEHIFIKLRVNGSEQLNFIFDTGAASTAISSHRARKLRLASDGMTSVRTSKGPSLAYYSKRNTLRLGQLELNDVRIAHIQLDHLEKVMEKRVDGIIGHDLLNHYVVMVNYDRYVLEIYHPDEFIPPQDFSAHQVQLISGRPYIDAALKLSNGEILAGRFQIDNGSGSSVTVYSPFVDENDLFSKVGKTELIYTMNFTGVIDKNLAGRLNGIDVGNFRLTNIPIRLNRSMYMKKAFKDGIGHIGNELLKRFNIAFDYRSGITYWKPNQSFVEEFQAAYSGLVVKTDQQMEKVYIKHVFDDSPAAMAGLAEDDEIVMINNVKTLGRTSFEVQDLLQNTTANNIEIVIKRNNQLKRLNLYPKSL
ncbi:MAG: aspartyl protease family protein [Cyclobacteriaceae bacterium]